MELIIVALLIVVLIFLFLVWMEMRNSTVSNQENQYRLLMKAQETVTQDQSLIHQFQNVVDQMQTMRKEQAASYQAMDRVQHHIESMNRVMTNTKARGNWGEYQLNFLLEMYAGNDTHVYAKQYTLQNGKIADAVLFLPNTDKVLCLDSKFPMENYMKKEDRGFKANMKKHIDDIAAKYINQETVDQAILFLPSEAVYQFICASQEEILNYALQKHVLLTSPTTLIGVIFTLLASTKDFYRASHMEEIEKNMLTLQQDVKRLCSRSDRAEKTLDTLHKQFHEVSTSANKIASRMEKIANGKDMYD